MDLKSNTALSKSRSQNRFALMSPQAKTQNSLLSSPRMFSPDTSSTTIRSSYKPVLTHALSVSKIPIHEMFKKHRTLHSGTILPEHLYHPPKSTGCLRSSPSYLFPKTKNKSFIKLVEEHSKKVPAPTAYERKMQWISKTARDLSKGSMRRTVIDQIYREKKKIPSPTAYKTMKKWNPKGGQWSKAKGFDFLSETQHLAQRNPSPNQYEIKEKLVMKSNNDYKIVKGNKKKMTWKPVKKGGA